MEATGQSGRKYSHILWLAGGAIVGIGALVAWQLSTKPTPASRTVIPVVDQSAELRAELQRLQRKVSRLESDSQAQGPTRAAPNAPEQSDMKTRKIEPEPEDPELAEARSSEQVERQIDARYAVFERRFAAEPVDNSRTAPEEQTVRQHIAELKGTELSKAECRATMCRFELKSDAPNAAGMLMQLGLTQGGTVRRSEDGTFLVFAGRDGFPFHEVNRAD